MKNINNSYKSKSRRQLKAVSHSMKSTVQIGKNGLTDSVVKEIKKQLKMNSLVKVKFLRSSLEEMDKKEMARLVAAKTGARLVHFVGLVATLYEDNKG